MTDAMLVAAAKRGQRAAFEQLCGNSAQRILRTTFRITRNREDAEDAVQDAFLKAFTHMKDFDGRSSFSTWLTRIAINSALMILRKKRLGREISVDALSEQNESGIVWEISDSKPGPETQYLQEEREQLLWKAISGLRPSIRIRKSLRPRAIGGAPMLRPAARFVQGTAAYRQTRNVELP
jgi:RNA polymerase sigma factor (sigma-70 family)